MPTFAQLSTRTTRVKPKNKLKSRHLRACPQRMASVQQITTMSPRKPNSARRTLLKWILL